MKIFNNEGSEALSQKEMDELLYFAVQSQNDKDFTKLVKEGANINKVDENGNNLWVAYARSYPYNVKLADAMIKSKIPIRGTKRMALLVMLLDYENDFEVVSHILKLKPDAVKEKEHRGYPLDDLDKGGEEFAKMFIDAGADVTTKDKSGKTIFDRIPSMKEYVNKNKLGRFAKLMRD